MRNVSLLKKIMKAFTLIYGFLCLVCFNACFDGEATNKTEISKYLEIENTQKLKKLRHLVLLKFKETATQADIYKVEQAFAELPSLIEQIKEFEWGLNNSPENLNKGYTHGFLLTFDNETDRDLYLPHPDHKAFVKVLEPILDDVLVVDYWTNTN